MKIKITVLCENLVGKLVGSGEHGFSAFIETAEGNFSSIPEAGILSYQIPLP